MIKINRVGPTYWEPYGIGAFYYWQLKQKKELWVAGLRLMTWESEIAREYDWDKGVALKALDAKGSD